MAKIEYVDGWVKGSIHKARHRYENKDGVIHIAIRFIDQGRGSQWRWIARANHRGETKKHNLGETKTDAVNRLRQSLDMNIAQAMAELDLLRAIRDKALEWLDTKKEAVNAN